MHSDPTFPSNQHKLGWSKRWDILREHAGIPVSARLCIGLSGGADSVLLLSLVANATPAHGVVAVHVDHALRGSESDADASFCADLCGSYGIRLVRRTEAVRGNGAENESLAAGIEAEARARRYAALAEEAHAFGADTVLVGHHADDLLETLLLRWMRGTDMAGLPGMRIRTRLWPGVVPAAALDAKQNPGTDRSTEKEFAEQPTIDLVRPLLSLRRSEVRELLRQAAVPWCEDSSNVSFRFSRNRIRNEFLPQLTAACGPVALDGLYAFASAVEKLEDELAWRTLEVEWNAIGESPPKDTTKRADASAARTQWLSRSALTSLAPILQRRALWRLLSEATNRSPGRALLDILLDDLEHGRVTRRSLPARWTLELHQERLLLVPPCISETDPTTEHQLTLPYPDVATRVGSSVEEEVHLSLPGVAQLPDGRMISAEIIEVKDPDSSPPSGFEVELDPKTGSDETRELTVRWARPGDRFHGLGAPGSRPLRRFLADAGVPRAERAHVPLVFAGSELIWVVGIRPCEGRRVHNGQSRRLRLRLLGEFTSKTSPESATPDKAAGA
ncbi:MAG: tRNA(Ile)-lysidine synthase [Planctomycetota bacterium]|jgi:tRNA(Ile)-lysidine synthase